MRYFNLSQFLADSLDQPVSLEMKNRQDFKIFIGGLT